MIAEYAGNYFKISLVRKPTRIWRYNYTEGFQKKTKGDGLVVYEKYIDLDEADQIFDVGFSVNWDGEWCGVYYCAENDLLSIYSNNRDFATAHYMEEFERGAFSCGQPAQQFSEYRMWKRDYFSKTESYTMVSYCDFQLLWKQMIADLVPPQ